jgi:hypothetical protein
VSDSDRWDEMANMVALVVDAKACAKRLDDMRLAQKKLDEQEAQVRKSLKDAMDAVKLVDEKTARAADVMKDAELWQGALDKTKKALDIREGEIVRRENEATRILSDVKFREDKLGERENTLAHREAGMQAVHKSAEEKLSAAEKLMASYDQAKHEAALKLAG